MKKLATTLALVAAVAALFGFGGYIYIPTAMHGFSARAEPSRMQTGAMKMTGMSGDMSGMKMDHSAAITPH